MKRIYRNGRILRVKGQTIFVERPGVGTSFVEQEFDNEDSPGLVYEDGRTQRRRLELSPNGELWKVFRARTAIVKWFKKTPEGLVEIDYDVYANTDVTGAILVSPAQPL